MTIIEILVVVGIIAIVSASLVPLIGMFAPTTRLSGDAKILVSSSRKAQHLSMSTQKRYGIKFYRSLAEYRLFVREFNEDTGTYEISETETVSLSIGINFDRIEIEGVEQTVDPRIYFDAFGAPKDVDENHIHMQITLINTKNQTKTIDIRKNTGHVKTL